MASSSSSPAATQSEPEEFLGIKQVRLFCVKGCTLSTGTEVAVDYHPDTKDRMEIFGGGAGSARLVYNQGNRLSGRIV